MMKTVKLALLHTLVLVTCLAANQAADASLILRLTGTAGSNVMTYEASGSVDVISSINGLNSGIALAPVGGFWTGGFDNNLGNFLRDTMNGSFNDNLALSNGGVSYRLNGIEFLVFDLLDLDGSATSGGDDVELDFSGTAAYPTIAPGDTLSWVGSGTFVLEDGETFDTLFTDTGTFSNTIEGGSYQVIIAEATNTAIPEPSSLLVFAGLFGFALARRRRGR